MSFNELKAVEYFIIQKLSGMGKMKSCGETQQAPGSLA